MKGPWCVRDGRFLTYQRPLSESVTALYIQSVVGKNDEMMKFDVHYVPLSLIAGFLEREPFKVASYCIVLIVSYF